MFDHFTFGTPSKARTIGHDEDGQICPKEKSDPAPAPLSQPYQLCTAFGTSPGDSIRNETQPQSDKGENPGIDVITHRLSNSHLRIEDCLRPPAVSGDSTSTCSSASSYFPPIPLDLEADRRSRKHSLSTQCLRRTGPATSPMIASSASSLEEESARISPHPRQDLKRLRRQMSSKFNKDPQNAWAIQTLVEGTVSTGSRGNVYTPPLEPITPIDTDNTNTMDYEMEVKSLEVDENPGDDNDYESPFIEKFLALRRASGTTGLRKSGFPLHQSSTDTALRCQHLVRNRPRMRKRSSKLRRKSSLATIPTGEAPSVGASPASS